MNLDHRKTAKELELYTLCQNSDSECACHLLSPDQFESYSSFDIGPTCGVMLQFPLSFHIMVIPALHLIAH